MNDLLISLLVLALIFGALVGMVVRPLLSERHLHPDSRDVVKMATGLIGTLAALVLGLLIASAKNSFDQKTNEVRQVIATNNPSGRSACAIWFGSSPCPKSATGERSTVGQSHLA